MCMHACVYDVCVVMFMCVLNELHCACRAYMVCPKQLDPVLGDCPRSWVLEVGVMGFGGR